MLYLDTFYCKNSVDPNQLASGKAIWSVSELVSVQPVNSVLSMGLVARKPVFGGLRTTQAQTSLRILAVWSAPLLFTLSRLATGKISIF